ncbi:Hsp70 family protein [Aldersonia sp. NBC_00410]|uniref:Hsp70 family protein n=1 Tax=Aldersonia sp. NBC_00410 TaxID=2975954 RepID=UPI00225BBEA0|nr:Hsp70 family protein [Aldersonia sp. NBC_00410]MCX5042046.1 Hsp70 family protein [Aldersonia sp. NBC_00410]
MGSVLGVSMGTGAIHMARPGSRINGHPVPFDLQRVDVSEQRPENLTAEIIGVALAGGNGIDATAVACRQDGRADALRTALAHEKLANYQLVPEVIASLELFASTGELNGFRSVAVYDLGTSGLSISVVDTERKIVHGAERTTDISGRAFDAMIGEAQIASGRLALPTDADGFNRLDLLCREAKEQLSTSTAVALPAPEGLVLLSRKDFEMLIAPTVEASARLLRNTIVGSRKPVEAIVLIGGGARIPLVANVLRSVAGLPVIVANHPDTVAARGAALLAHPVSRRRAWQESRETAGPAGAAEKIRRRRELVSAAIAVGGLALLAVLGFGLTKSTDLFNGTAGSSGTLQTTSPQGTDAAGAPGSATPGGGSFNGLPGGQPLPVVAPPPVTLPPPPPPAEAPPTWDEDSYQAPAPAPAPGPNTFSVPGLPPIVVPTIPPQYIPPLPRLPRFP